MNFLNFHGLKRRPNAPWSKYYKDGEMELDIPDTSVYNYFENKVLKFGDKICIDYYDRKIRYNELLSKIDDCAKGLYDYGIRKGDVVTLCLPNTLEGIVSFFAINKIGAIVNFIHPASSENEIKKFVNDMNSKIIIAIDSNYWKIENIEKETELEKIILVSLNNYMPFINKIRYCHM